MPLLDVSFMTVDPMLAHVVAVRRRLNIVGDDGRVTALPDQFFPKVIGVVTQQDSSLLMRAEDGQTFPKRIFIAARFQFLVLAPGQQPDEITWNGVIYTAESVQPYPQYGRGHYQCVAEFRGNVPAAQ